MALSRTLTAMTTAATLVLALAACGDRDNGDDSDDEQGDGGTPAEPVQFRRVLEQTTDACPDPAVQPDPAAEAIACDDEGTSHRLAPAEIVGGVEDAEAAMSPDGGGWTVAVELDDEATTTFEAITRELVGTQQQVAIVTGGRIVTAPVIQSAIADGKVQIAGDLDRDEADSLADALEG